SPRWPSAGPIGGLGLALPAGTCSLMNPITFFAMLVLLVGANERSSVLPGYIEKLCLLDLPEFQLDRRRPAEDRHRYPKLRLVVIHVLDRAVEIGERALPHAHGFADLPKHLGLRLLDAFLHLLHDAL